MSKQDNWEKRGKSKIGGYSVMTCLKHNDNPFLETDACIDCFTELEQENERLTKESVKIQAWQSERIQELERELEVMRSSREYWADATHANERELELQEKALNEREKLIEENEKLQHQLARYQEFYIMMAQTRRNSNIFIHDRRELIEQFESEVKE